MADDLQVFTAYCEGGLNTNRDLLSQGERQPGSAIRLINYEPSLTGGYRRISGYEHSFPNLPGNGRVLGLCVVDGINDGILALRNPDNIGDAYLHYWDMTSEVWQPVSASSGSTDDFSNTERVRFVTYNWGEQRVLFVDGINEAHVYNGTTLQNLQGTLAPDAPSVAAAYANHMFLSGDPSEPTNLYFSAPVNELDYTPANGAGVINVGFPVTQLKVFRNELYIFGFSQIKKLSGTNIADFNLEDVTQDLGCIAADSVVEIGGDLLFLGPDGIRPISATDRLNDVELETVSKDIQSYMAYLNANAETTIPLENLCSVIVRGKSQFRYFFANDSTEEGIVGGLRKNQNGQIGFEFGQLLGFNATCAASGYIGREEYVLHGDLNGNVYRQEVGTSFDGGSIFSVFQTPYYHMGDPEVRKHFLKCTTYLRAEGEIRLLMGVLYDYEDQSTLSPASYAVTVEGAAAYYNDVATFDGTAIYDGNPTPLIRTNVSGSGRAVSIKYVTQDTNESHSIQGLVLLFGVDDRR